MRDAVAARRQRLFADAADRQHEPGERDLARSSRRRSCTGTPRAADTIAVAMVTPGRRAVLRDGAGRHVDVQVVLGQRLGRDAERTAPAARTWLSAARADSCITLPSWPVSVRCPLPPGSSTASMNSTSPPVSVHATPVATPGPRRAERASPSGSAAGPGSRARPRRRRWPVWVESAATRAATLRAIVPICRSSERTPASRVYSKMTRRSAASAIVELVGPQAVLVELPRDEVHPRDVELLVLGVAAERDDLHAIEQRRVDRAELVRGRDEEHPRQVDRDLEVVIAERVVLRRVEHLEQRRRRIALHARPRSCRSRRA